MFRRMHSDHPAIAMLTKAKNNKGHQIDWFTFKNINNWTNAAMKVLIIMKVAKDKRGYINEC